MTAVGDNVARLREEIDRLAGPGKVTVIGVTKFQSPDKIREAVSAGLRHLGNNYAQEGESLLAALAGQEIEWHFIGHIQSRKAKYLVEYDCVQSLDRLEVARALEARLLAAGRKLDALVEVNVGGEASKSGVAPEAIGEFLEGLRPLSQLRVRGLMGMPPPLEPIESRRPYFRRLRQLLESLRGEGLDCLSMGTSEDFRLAIEEGATMVRLGTVLFGARPPKA
jgi:pyridoxal phosphate enzyme (YggS family)